MQTGLSGLAPFRLPVIGIKQPAVRTGSKTRGVSLRFLAAFLFLIISFIATNARGQASGASSGGTFDLDKDREAMVLLNGNWRFHTGDDPLWAEPGLDDSAWPTISAEKSWSEQGYEGYAGVAWYRARILIPAGTPPLSLYIPEVATNYEVFADGVPLGGRGRMPPDAVADGGPNEVFALPQTGRQDAGTVVIAIRVWHWPRWANFYGGGLRGGLRIGETGVVQRRAALIVANDSWSWVSNIILAILEVLAGLAGVFFFLLRRQAREYLWFGIMLIFSVLNRCFSIYVSFHVFGVSKRDLMFAVLQVGSGLAALAFFQLLLQGRKNWLFWLAVASPVANLFVEIFADRGWLGVAASNEIRSAIAIPYLVWVFALLVHRAVRGVRDARLLVVPILITQVVGWLAQFRWIGFVTGWYQVSTDWYYTASEWPFPYTLQDLGDGLFLAGMLGILVYRFVRSRRQERVHEREREAAGSIQQVLIPEEAPKIPGFEISCVYRPASEVGGDFYLILPCRSGGVVLIIGDVSGKGLPAAMIVSLMVGVAQMAVEATTRPGEILAALNRRLQGRSRGGFTTCLALHAATDGSLLIANAGHIAPYCNGEELPLDNGFPLGIVAGATFAESTFRLAPGDQLTLLTDGVVEARNRARELFGFERTQAISIRSAEEIALAAQQFGQDDDITALTLSYVPQPATA